VEQSLIPGKGRFNCFLPFLMVSRAYLSFLAGREKKEAHSLGRTLWDSLFFLVQSTSSKRQGHIFAVRTKNWAIKETPIFP